MIKLPHPKYFEGILQLRNPSPELVGFVRRAVQRDQRALIVREKKVRNGLDLYLSSQRYLRALGKKLKQAFPGELKMSRSLHTISKAGKELYRVTVLFRLLKFKKGDVLKAGDEELEILRIDARVLAKNIRTGKKKRYAIAELERYVRDS